MYTLTSADHQVPAQLAIELDDDTADRVEHRFPAEQPGFAEIGQWRYLDGGSEELSLGGRLPNVATQRAVTMLVARDPDGRAAVDDYQAYTFPWAEDAFVVGSYPAKAEPPGPDEGWIFAEPYERTFAPPGPGTFTWHYTGPTLPGAIRTVTTDSGWAPIQIQLCSGCREGNTLFPQMYVTNPSGYQTNYTTGVHNDRGALFIVPGTRGCESPFCEITLTDQGGHEYDQTLTPVSALAGSGATGDAGAPTAPGGVVNLVSPFMDVSETEADR
jgi:hypothetical protein